MSVLTLFNPGGKIGLALTIYNAYTLYRNVQGIYELYQWCVTGIRLLRQLKNLLTTPKINSLHEEFIIVDSTIGPGE